jgi:ribose 5-phosphate isomerase B
MKVAVGFDHGGWTLRQTVIDTLKEAGHEVIDLGASSPAPSDHPDFAAAVAHAVAGGEADVGILACGTGIGMAITANKVPGAYAANVSEEYSARMARLHNGANILTLGGRTVGPELARSIIRTFLETGVDPGERYDRRRGKIRKLEQCS